MVGIYCPSSVLFGQTDRSLSCLTIRSPDPVLALAGLSEYPLAKIVPIRGAYIQHLMNKFALMVLLFKILIIRSSQFGEVPLRFNGGPKEILFSIAPETQRMIRPSFSCFALWNFPHVSIPLGRSPDHERIRRLQMEVIQTNPNQQVIASTT